MIFMPAVIIGFTLIPTYLADREPESVWTIAVADESGIAAEELSAKLAEQLQVPDNKNSIRLIPIIASNADSILDRGKQMVKEGVVDGFMLLDSRTIENKNILLFMKSGGYSARYRMLEDAAKDYAVQFHARKIGLSPEQIRTLSKASNVQIALVDSEDSELIQKYLTGIILVMMLFFAIFNSGGSFMRGISEEKNNRVIEILVSSVTPRELMTGKILGLGCVGLMQIFFWGCLGSVFGGQALGFLSPLFLTYFTLYFVFGFLLFAGIFSMVGSVLSSEQDIQPIQAVLSVVGILPVALAILVLQDPDSALVSVLSYVPLLTPTLMILRLVITTPGTSEIVGTMVVLILSVWLILHLASKVFHVAFLLQGKKPQMKEVIRWAKA